MALKYKHVLMFVDDEPSITNALKRLFRGEGYEIHTASSGQEALDKIKGMPKPPSLIISDQRMPGMTGAELFEKIKKMLPQAMRILLTGYSDMDAIVNAVNRGEIHRYFTKPWNDGDLVLQVRQSLEQYELTLENRRLLALTKRQNLRLKQMNERLEQKVEERSREILEKNKALSTANSKLEANLYNTIRAFASLADMGMPRLAGHGRRVSLMAREIGKALELDEREILYTEVAALLHDIGKMGFSDKLLSYRMDQWSKEELENYRKHPEKGQATVQFIDSLDHAGILIRCHHEQYDGQGYPGRLTEDEIPLGARIIAVADAYDKIVHLKVDLDGARKEVLQKMGPDRDRMEEAEILQKAAVLHLKEHGFTRYDPDVVKSFLAILKDKGVGYGRERRVKVEELREGMTLSRSLYSSSGRFLIPYNTVLTKAHIEKIKTFHKLDPISDLVCVVNEFQPKRLGTADGASKIL